MTTLDHEQSGNTTWSEDSGYIEACKRVEGKRNLTSNFVAYVVVNAFLVAVWALTGFGYFWPAWLIACWGIGLVLHAWEVFFRRPISDEDVRAELEHHRR